MTCSPLTAEANGGLRFALAHVRDPADCTTGRAIDDAETDPVAAALAEATG